MARILYVGTKNASSWSLRAWLALREQGIPFEERLIDIRRPQRTSELARIREFSPPGAVPVLVDGELVVFDSLAIMEYASELGERPLLPPDRERRARARSLMAWMHSGLSELCSGMSFESTFVPDRPPATPAAREEAARVVAAWSDELARHGGPFLVGDLSLADLAFVPTVRRLVAHGVSLDGHPEVAAWIDRLMSRPHVVEWMREAEALPPVLGV